MRIEVLEEAKEDLISGYYFDEKQSPGLGSYFLDSLYSDIDSLLLYAGTHRAILGSHRCLSRRFPFAIYYGSRTKPFASEPFLIADSILR